MPHKTPGGFAIVLPEMGIDAMLKASQSEFLERLLAKNPTLPASQLTKHNLFSCVMGLIARLGQEGPFSAGIKAQIQVVQQQWISSTTADVLHELFAGKPGKIDAEQPATATSVPDHIGSNQALIRTKPQSKRSRFGSMLPYNRNTQLEIARFLEQHHRRKLMQNGNCLLVSLPSVTAHTLPTTTTHAHLFDRTDQAGSLRHIQLLMDSYPTIVLAYDSKALKDLAARQIESLKFQFQDSDPIKLDIQEFGDSSASARARYSLGTGSLYFCDYQESLQQFFCMEGFVPVRDVIRTRRTGVIDTELLIRYRLSPSFMQKLTALPGGHQDTRIPAEAAESCSLCPHTTTKDQLQSSPQNALQLKVIPSSVSSCNRGANPEISGRPFLRIPGPGFAAIHRSLEDLKITGYIQHSTLLNGIEATSKVPLPLFVRGFNKFLDTFYSDYDFEAKLAVLHRIDGGERVGEWELLCQELRRLFTLEYMSVTPVGKSKRKSLADNVEAARKRPKRPVAANFF